LLDFCDNFGHRDFSPGNKAVANDHATNANNYADKSADNCAQWASQNENPFAQQNEEKNDTRQARHHAALNDNQTSDDKYKHVFAAINAKNYQIIKCRFINLNRHFMI
jgi:hypothetical protein